MYTTLLHSVIQNIYRSSSHWWPEGYQPTYIYINSFWFIIYESFSFNLMHESVKYRQFMCNTNPSPVYVKHEKYGRKRANPYNRKTQSLFVAATSTYIFRCYNPYIYDVLVYYSMHPIVAYFMCDRQWMALTTWTLSYSAIAVYITYIYVFLYIYWNGWNGSHNMSLKLATYKVFLLLCVLSVFATAAAALWICERLCVSSG